jgi:hypothetical protein
MGGLGDASAFDFSPARPLHSLDAIRVIAQGKEYKNVTVSRVEADGLVLKGKSGISKVYFTELPKEVQQRFHYEPAQAAEFTAATQAGVQSFNAEAVRQQQESKRALEQQRLAAERQARLEAELQKKVEAEHQAQFAARAAVQRQQLANWQAAKTEESREQEIRALRDEVNAARIEAARARREAKAAQELRGPEAYQPHH